MQIHLILGHLLSSSNGEIEGIYVGTCADAAADAVAAALASGEFGSVEQCLVDRGVIRYPDPDAEVVPRPRLIVAPDLTESLRSELDAMAAELADAAKKVDEGETSYRELASVADALRGERDAKVSLADILQQQLDEANARITLLSSPPLPLSEGDAVVTLTAAGAVASESPLDPSPPADVGAKKKAR